jgi:hypothetical protein
MANFFADGNMSELEREFELEMDDHEIDNEFENEDDHELEDDHEFEAPDFEGGDFEFENDSEYESFGGSYAEQLSELASREFESESELDGALSRVLGEMEQEFFFGGLAKKIARSRLGRMGMSRLKGFLKNKFPNIPGLGALGGLSALTQIARGNLKGGLLSLAKTMGPQALAFVPGGAAVMPALSALGVGEASDPEHENWEAFVDGAREAYDHLANNLHEAVDQPLEASRLATAAFQKGVQRMGSAGVRRAGVVTGTRRRIRTIRLKRGQRIRIIAE